MDPTYFLMILSYWVFLSGALFTAGAFVCRVLVTGPAGADICISSAGGKCLGDSAASAILAGSLIVFVINMVHLVLHCAVMTETPLSEVFSVLPTFITKTKYGRLSILRTLFLFAVGAAAFADLKKNAGWSKISGIVFSLGLLIVIAMSGHQGAEGYFTLPFSVDIVHMVSVSLWIGGLFFLRFCYSFIFLSSDAGTGDALRTLMDRFSRLATSCVAAAGLTGIVLSFYNLKSVSLVFGTQYGIVLFLKALLVTVILLLGGANKYFFLPDLNRTIAGEPEAVLKPARRLYFTVTTEVFFGFLVLLLTSLLTHLSPED